MKKRFFSITLLFTLLLSLIGCSTQTGDTGTGWQFFTTSSGGALSEQGYYYCVGGFLHYADLAVGESVALCSLPGCTHKDDELCDAYIGPWIENSVFFTNDRLYYYLDGVMYSRSAIGTEEKQVGIPCKKYLEEGGAISTLTMMQVGNWAYYRASIEKKGDQSEITSVIVLGRMDLTTGEDTVLVELLSEEETKYGMLSLGAVREDGILYLQCDGFQVVVEIDADPEDENYEELYQEAYEKIYQEKSQSVTVKLQRWDAATGKVTTLLEKPRGEMSQICMAYAGKLYYYGSAGVAEGKELPLYAYDLKTGAVETVAGMEAISRWLGGPYVTIVGNRLVNIETRELLPREGEIPIPAARSASGFVMMQTRRDVPEEEQAFEYYYIPYSSMADGIQQADKTLIAIELLHPVSDEDESK